MKSEINALTHEFIRKARVYRFLYQQPRHDDPLVQGIHNQSILQAHTAARDVLKKLLADGLPGDLAERCQTLLMPRGVSDSDMTANAEALLAWAKPVAVAPVEPVKRRTGRLSKTESDTKKAELLAACSAHPTLMNDFTALARTIGISEDTCRRWLNDFNKKHSGKPKQ